MTSQPASPTAPASQTGSMSELLRRAALVLTTPREVDFCSCMRPDPWFDRSICPDPCGSMHDVCSGCGYVMGHCSFQVAAAQPTAHAVTLAGWLTQHADLHDEPAALATGCFDGPAAPGCPGAAVAQTVLNDWPR